MKNKESFPQKKVVDELEEAKKEAGVSTHKEAMAAALEYAKDEGDVKLEKKTRLLLEAERMREEIERMKQEIERAEKRIEKIEELVRNF